MLTTESMIADAPDEKGDGGMAWECSRNAGCQPALLTSPAHAVGLMAMPFRESLDRDLEAPPPNWRHSREVEYTNPKGTATPHITRAKARKNHFQ